MKFSIKFFNHRFAFICRILKIRKIHSKHEWQHLFQRYAANATMIAVTFPARRSPLTGVSKWNDLVEKKLELDMSDGNGKYEKIFDSFEAS